MNNGIPISNTPTVQQCFSGELLSKPIIPNKGGRDNGVSSMGIKAMSYPARLPPKPIADPSDR